ncbi:MAG: DUF1874 domain-containing protein [Desulfurococcaceae archaeon]
MKYLVNSISLNMFNLSSDVGIKLHVKHMNTEDFCKEIDEATSAIGHQATAQLLMSLCGKQISMNRVEVKINDKDELLVVQLLTRLPEGKVLSFEEIAKLLNNGLIKLLKVRVRITESSEKKKYVVVKRVSDSSYSYAVKLYDGDIVIDEDVCGELAYWGIPDVKNCFEAVNELLKRNRIDDAVDTYYCGGFYQPKCPSMNEYD